MEQKDFLLREIEKIGTLLRMILNSFTGKNENITISNKCQFEKTKELLFNEIDFDFEKFLSFDISSSKDYILQFNGINTDNLELLAEIILQFSINEKSEKRKTYLEKALQIYELCNLTDKTFSFERESNITKIKKLLITPIEN
ncbi:MAG: hypothetical protein A2X08_10335 [Bacteroidetes bacterium GWA2_32_17]|nr:MAG: hypothetical protein A2X08_10335 [Bacteroidetes bacterium GWA2_32_17]